MGAIKEGDNPEDYYIEYNALRAYGGLSLMSMIGLTTAAAVGYAVLTKPKAKSKTKLIKRKLKRGA